MAKKKKSRKQLIAGGIAAGVIGALYASLLPLNKPIHFIIFAALMALAGWVVYTMAGGLDVSQKAPVQRPTPASGNPTVDQLVQQGMKMLSEIREENALIPDAELSGKIDQLEDIARRIFSTVADKPEKAPQIRRFMDYYLPTTLKMLQGYRKMDERQVSGANAEATRAQIRKAMDVVVRAFGKQLDALYQDDMLDLSTDIEVMETMLRQDGLVDSGLMKQEAEAKQEAGSVAAQGGE